MKFSETMAVYGGPAQSRPFGPSPGLSPAYDAYNTAAETQRLQQQQQQQQQQQASHNHHHPHSAQTHPHQNHIQQQPQQHSPPHPASHQQQPWYDVSDGSATPPDETGSHRDSRATAHSLTDGMKPTNCRVTVMAALELCVILALGAVEYILRVTGLFPVAERTFSCYDPDISAQLYTPVRWRNTNSTSNSLFTLSSPGCSMYEMVLLICFCLPPLFIAVCELILWLTKSLHAEHSTAFTISRECRLSLSFRRVVRFTGVYVFGLLITMITADTMKLLTGQLRPHFLAVCQLNWTMCDSLPHSALHSAYDVCLQPDESLLQQARKSFPSLQASMTSFAAFFMAVYIHNVVLCGRKAILLRPLLSLAFVFADLFCCLTIYTSQRSRWTDVVTGCGLGLAVAIYLAVCELDCFTESLSPRRLYARLDRALSAVRCSTDDLDLSSHGGADIKYRSSSSSTATDWRGAAVGCADSTSARSWSHYAVHHLTPLHPHTVDLMHHKLPD